MSRKEENRNVETLTTSELCSNSLPSCLPGNGKVECWPGDMRKIPAAKAGNMAIPFQSEFKIRRSRAFAPPDTGKIVLGGCCIDAGSPRWHCNKCEHEWGSVMEEYG